MSKTGFLSLAFSSHAKIIVCSTMSIDSGGKKMLFSFKGWGLMTGKSSFFFTRCRITLQRPIMVTKVTWKHSAVSFGTLMPTLGVLHGLFALFRGPFFQFHSGMGQEAN